MEQRNLGRTDIRVSVIALGCWPFAGGKYWDHQDDDDSVATVRAALDSGITFFDTAEGYGKGHSEQVLGRGLSGRRDEAVIATKVSANHLSPDGIQTACERSLANLGTDHIDLYQIHWPSREHALDASMATLNRLVEQGKILAIGVSNFAVGDLTDLLDIGAVETNQMPYSLLWRVIEPEIQPLCVEHGIGLICYSPLAQGLLTGRYASADEVPEGIACSRWYSSERPAAQHDEPGCEAEVFEAVAAVRRIAEDLGEPMASVSLAWARQQAGVTSLLVGARNPEELRRNLPAASLQLPDGAVASLSSATDRVKSALGSNADMWFSESRMR